MQSYDRLRFKNWTQKIQIVLIKAKDMRVYHTRRANMMKFQGCFLAAVVTQIKIRYKTRKTALQKKITFK